MSGTASVPTQFQNAVTATGLQLDTNFGTIVAYLNDPTNRNNYASAGGSTNTLNITFAPPVVGGYSAGLELSWKWNITNTGAVVLNANGLGNASLVNPDGSALAAGQGVGGSVGKAVYDGTQFIYMTGFAVAASQAQMETATSGILFVAPSLQKYHPLHPKAWANFNGTNVGTITALASVGVGQIVRVGTGTYSVVVSTAFSSTAWGWIVNHNADRCTLGSSVSQTNSAVQFVLVRTVDSAPQDGTNITFVAYGDLP